MKLIGRDKIFTFTKKHADSKAQFDSWEAETEEAQWKTPQDIKQRYVSASILADNHVVFNIKGNRYRLLVQISYKNGIVLIKNVGTHEEYMKW